MGKLSEEMGCPRITLKVCSHESRNLVYRFSEGMVCDWVAESEKTEKIGEVIDELRETNSGPQRKFF